MQPFSNLEIQLIRSSLGSRSDGEIAALLERSIEEIHSFIDSITDGKANERSERVQLQKESEHLKLSAKELRKQKREEERIKNEERRREKQRRLNT